LASYLLSEYENLTWVTTGYCQLRAAIAVEIIDEGRARLYPGIQRPWLLEGAIALPQPDRKIILRKAMDH